MILIPFKINGREKVKVTRSKETNPESKTDCSIRKTDFSKEIVRRPHPNDRYLRELKTK